MVLVTMKEMLAGVAEGISMEENLRRCAMASSIVVGREGAVPSIPYREEVLSRLAQEYKGS